MFRRLSLDPRIAKTTDVLARRPGRVARNTPNRVHGALRRLACDPLPDFGESLRSVNKFAPLCLLPTDLDLPSPVFESRRVLRCDDLVGAPSALLAQCLDVSDVGHVRTLTPDRLAEEPVNPGSDDTENVFRDSLQAS